MLMVNGKLHEKWSGKKRLWIKAVHCGFSSKLWPGIFPGQDFMEAEEGTFENMVTEKLSLLMERLWHQ